MEVTETPTVTQETGSELTTENEASGEQDEMITTGLDSMQPINSQEVAATSTDDWTTTLPHEGAVLDGGLPSMVDKGDLYEENIRFEIDFICYSINSYRYDV